jgi:hypothetical protein
MKSLLTAGACVLLGGCAAGGGGMYSEPYALLEPQQRMAVADTRPAFVMKIDGRNVDMGRSDPVPVGKRSVEVSIPGPPGMSDPDRDTLEIDAKPCTRYYLAARRSSPTARDWKAFVAENEPIGECVRKFQAAK